MIPPPVSPLRSGRWTGEKRHPYVIVTPPFTHLSAGIRALHWLCDALNQAGLEAYVAADPALGPPGADLDAGERSGLRAPRLRQERSDAFYREDRTPIVIYPETSREIQRDQFTVLYLLNYLGVLGGALEQGQFDFVMAYSQNIATRTIGCQDILFVPASDPDYWTPAASPSKRREDLIYAGKYIDFHHQAFPHHLRDARRIYRYGADAPTREELRSLLRGGRRLYIFENTAVATEACLCGCPVVACWNWFFRELIAQHELGCEGIASGEDPEEITRAETSVASFRERYLDAVDRFEGALFTMVERTQRLASAKIGAAAPFQVPVGGSVSF